MQIFYYIIGVTLLFAACKKEDPQKDETVIIPDEVTDTTGNVTDTSQNIIDTNNVIVDTLNVTDTSDVITDPVDTVVEPEPVILNTFLYASLDNDNKIAVYKVDTVTGSLELVEKESTKGQVGSLAISNSLKFLYAAIRSTGEVSTFGIDPATGKLHPVQTTKVVDNPVYIIPDKTNKYLLTAYYNAGKMAIYPISGDSIIESSPTVNQDAGINPHCIQTTPDNKYLYVPARGSDYVLQFQFNSSSGTVVASNPDKVNAESGAGPRHLAFHPLKDILYVVNENNNTVSTYTIDANGLLTNTQNISTLPADYIEVNTCADIHITPDGKFLYASNRGHNSIAAYSVNSTTGALTLINQYTTEPTPREFSLSPNGDFLYAGGEGSGKIAAYRIESNGTLAQFNTYAAGSKITWVLVSRVK